VVNLYPNPASNQLSIMVSSLNAHAHISVYSISGQRLINMRMDNPMGATTVKLLDISSLNTGVYFITVTSSSFTSTQRFVKQ
jgi:hypothetical protein